MAGDMEKDKQQSGQYGQGSQQSGQPGQHGQGQKTGQTGQSGQHSRKGMWIRTGKILLRTMSRKRTTVSAALPSHCGK